MYKITDWLYCRTTLCVFEFNDIDNGPNRWESFFFVVESFRIVSIRLSNREHSSPVTNSGLRIRVFTSNSLHHHREDDASIEAEQKFG